MKMVCRLSEDGFEVEESKIINLNCKKAFKYTFWKQNNIYAEFYKDEAIDLLYLSLAVFAADRLILRENGEDAWSREIELYMPVLCVDKWISCQSLLEEMLSFLTGDRWKICFRERELTEIEKKAKEKWEKVTEKNVNISKICMFSGGLDSCIGALNLLCDKEDASDTVFVSHYGGGKGTVEYQGMLKDAFINRFDVDESNFVQNYAAIVTKKEDKKEDTTRSRSFMFFSHAIAYASAMGKEIELIIPENGLISLNIPLAYTRTGTSSTTISFRITDAERKQIEARILASGMMKKDYFVRSCIYNRICVVGKKETIYPLVQTVNALYLQLLEMQKAFTGADADILVPATLDTLPSSEAIKKLQTEYSNMLTAIIDLLDGAKYLWEGDCHEQQS